MKHYAKKLLSLPSDTDSSDSDWSQSSSSSSSSSSQSSLDWNLTSLT